MSYYVLTAARRAEGQVDAVRMHLVDLEDGQHVLRDGVLTDVADVANIIAMGDYVFIATQHADDYDQGDRIARRPGTELIMSVDASGAETHGLANLPELIGGG